MPIVRANVVPHPFDMALSRLRYYMDAKLTGVPTAGGGKLVILIFF